MAGDELWVRTVAHMTEVPHVDVDVFGKVGFGEFTFRSTRGWAAQRVELIIATPAIARALAAEMSRLAELMEAHPAHQPSARPAHAGGAEPVQESLPGVTA